MKVLVTGGTGVVGKGAIDALLARGYEVRVLTRNAGSDAEEWDARVEAWQGDVADAKSLEGSMGGCQAVVHIAGIVTETPPDLTFDTINVGGTANVVAEAERVGVQRLIFVSSLGADTGESPYHQSKLAAETIVAGFSRQWLILRPGNVYGPGDEVISLLLKMIRTLPVVPLIGDGTQTFQPIWFEDLGKAIEEGVDRHEINRRILELGGDELTSMFDILERLSEITGRWPERISIPEFIAKAGARIGEIAGIELPVDSSKLQMLQEENYIRRPKDNALRQVFGIEPTPLQQGLIKLADAIPEVFLSDGVGPVQRKRFWADISATPYSNAQLFQMFKERFHEVMVVDIGAEPGSPVTFGKGTTLTGWLPLRGNFQIRAEQVTDRSATFVTLEGHPLAGVLHFLFEQRGTEVRFLIEIFARAANFLDLILMTTVGETMQDFTWESVVERVVSMSGGAAVGGVQSRTEMLEKEDAANIERWIRDLVMARRREEHAAGAARL